MEPTTTPVSPGAKQLNERFDEGAIAAQLESFSARETLEWAFDQFGQDMYIACSFQKTSSVVMEIATSINPSARFFYLDTDVLFPETYETRDRLAERFDVEFERWHNISLEEQAETYGDKLWKSNPDACCGLRKVEPMRRALSTVDAWVAGVRRADSASRAGTPKFAWDKKFNIWKLNPLADWSERDVWNHLSEHNV
ncbi:MAG: phosphoadenylyl-sulfate reductase, partial [Solirubrobacterales bacterium]